MLTAAPKPSLFGKGGALDPTGSVFGAPSSSQPTDSMTWDKAADPPVGANGMYVITKSGRRARLTGSSGGVYVDKAPMTPEQITGTFGNTGMKVKAVNDATAASVAAHSNPMDPAVTSAASVFADLAGHPGLHYLPPAVDPPAAGPTGDQWWKTNWPTNDTSTTNPGDTGSGGGVNTGGKNYYKALSQILSDAQSQMTMTPTQLAAIEKSAASQAAGVVNAKTGAASAQKKQYVQEAENRANAVMAAYRAMAGMAQGDASQVQNAYQSAGRDMASVAKGFTGAIAPMATQEAAMLNAQLRGISSSTPASVAGPPPSMGATPTNGATLSDANSTGYGYAPVPNSPTPSTIGPNLPVSPGAAGNALYQMHGQIPSNNFFQTGARDFAALKHEPLGIMNTGIDAMRVAQHASDTKEQTLNNYINSVKAQLPQLTNTALTNLMNAYKSSGNEAYKMAALKIAALEHARKDSQGDVKLTTDQGKLSFDEWYKQSGRTIQQQNADTARYRADHPAASILKPQDVWKIVSGAAIGVSKPVTNLGKTTNFLTQPALNDPGNAIRYVMSHTGMTETEAMAALNTYNGLRVQNGLPAYNFPSYMSSRYRHEHPAVLPSAAKAGPGTTTSTLGI